MVHSDFERQSWMSRGRHGLKTIVAVVAALVLGVAAATYARAGDEDPSGAIAPALTETILLR